ncbi:MAG TPA: ATP-binding protein [Candidatus Angelobacter sp.]
MFNKPFSELALHDFENLIAARATEGQDLEFKRQTWGGNDEEVREMLRDISSMANAVGGYILVGMDEDESGTAKLLEPVPDAEKERDRILASCLANLNPRIIGLDIKTVQLSPSEQVLLLRAPNSAHLHQVTFKGLYQFWIRHDRQKTRMTYEEIREAITKRQVNVEQAARVWERSKSSLDTNASPFLQLAASPLMLSGDLIDIADQSLRTTIQQSPSSRVNGWTFNFPYKRVRPTLNGLRIGSIEENRGLELHRNGFLEGYVLLEENHALYEKRFQHRDTVEARLLIKGLALTEFVHSFMTKARALYDYIGYQGPLLICARLANIREIGLWPYAGERMHDGELLFWGEGTLDIDGLVFEFVDANLMTKILCDRVWQAFGLESEPFSNNGQFDFGRFS